MTTGTLRTQIEEALTLVVSLKKQAEADKSFKGIRSNPNTGLKHAIIHLEKALASCPKPQERVVIDFYSSLDKAQKLVFDQWYDDRQKQA